MQCISLNWGTMQWFGGGLHLIKVHVQCNALDWGALQDFELYCVLVLGAACIVFSGAAVHCARLQYISLDCDAFHWIAVHCAVL